MYNYDMKKQLPIIKLILQLVIACLLLFIILFVYLIKKKPTQKNNFSTNSPAAKLTIKNESAYQIARQELLAAEKISVQYQGQIVALDDSLTKKYLLNILKNAQYTINTQALRYPEKNDLVFNLGQNRLVIIGKQTSTEFMIETAYLLYEKNLLSDQLHFNNNDFAIFLQQLLNKHFAHTQLLPTTGSSNNSPNNLSLIGEQPSTIINYLEKFRLKFIAIEPTWKGQLITNENSQLNSSAPHQAKLLFAFSPPNTLGKFYLNYQPYNWLGKDHSGPEFNFNEQDYLQLIARQQSPANQQLVEIANTKGFISHQLIKINQGETHLMRIAYFPFFYYYLCLSADLGELNAVDEAIINQLNQQQVPPQYQSSIAVFDKLIASLIFMDKQ